MRDIIAQSDEEKAIRYRYRAEKIRALTVLSPDRKIQNALLIVAARYDAVAAVLERATA